MPEGKPSTTTLKEHLMNLTRKKSDPTKTGPSVHEQGYFEQQGPLIALASALNKAHEKYNNPAYVGNKEDFINRHSEYYGIVGLTPSLQGNENPELRLITRTYQRAWAQLLATPEDSPRWDESARDVHAAFITLKVAHEVVGDASAKKSLKGMEPPALPESAHLLNQSAPSSPKEGSHEPKDDEAHKSSKRL